MSTKEPSFEFVAGNVKEAMKGIGSGDAWNVPFEQIYVQEGFNVREDTPEYRAHCDYIYQLIKANGFDRSKTLAGYVALIDGVSRVVLTDGHTRYKAVARLRDEGVDIKTVPIITAPRGTTTEDLIVALATSNTGKPLAPYELGTVIKRLIAAGWEEKEIANKLGITAGYVSDLLLLHSAPRQIREWVRTGKIAAGLAIATIKQHGPKAAEVLQKALDNAKAQGKDKASKKDVAPTWKQAVKKSGPDLYDAIMWVKEDAAYKKLSDGTRETIEKLLASLPEEPEESKK